MALLHNSVDMLLQELHTGPGGLTEEEAARRLKTDGENSLEESRVIGDVEAFFRQFLNPLVLVLLISALLSYFLGELRGSFMIGALVFFSVCLQFYHERRSMKAAAALKRRVSVHATVLRDGVKKKLSWQKSYPAIWFSCRRAILFPAMPGF